MPDPHEIAALCARHPGRIPPQLAAALGIPGVAGDAAGLWATREMLRRLCGVVVELHPTLPGASSRRLPAS